MGSTNSKPPARFIWLANQKREKMSDHIYYSLLLHVHNFATFFTNLRRPSKFSGDQFPWLNRHMLTFLHRILMCTVTFRAPAVGILLVMKNWRSVICAPWIRECGVHITKHLKKFPSAYRFWKARRHFISIHSPRRTRRDILCPFIKSVKDLIG